MNLGARPAIEKIEKSMVTACENMQLRNWNELKARINNELQSFTLMLKWLKDMREKGEIGPEQARIHIDIQRNTMRTRLMAMPGMDMLMAENLLNVAIDAVRKDIYDYLGWVVV